MRQTKKNKQKPKTTLNFRQKENIFPKKDKQTKENVTKRIINIVGK